MNFAHLRHQGCAGCWSAYVHWKKDSDAPDYTPVANASVESAQIADKLGRDQMAQARQLHDENMAIAKPVVDSQLSLMEQAKTQGDDYYNYMVTRQRPVEDSLNSEAMANASATQDAADRSKILGLVDANAAQDDAERALITGGDTGVYNARQGDIEESVGRAVAGARAGQSATTNQMIRQAARYGWSPEKLASMAGAQGLGMASQQAAAANSTRQAGIQNARQLMGTSYDMRNTTNANRIAGTVNDRSMRVADDSKAWGKKMDVAGLYRGMVGASQGSYGLAGQMGSAAVSNQMQPGNQLLGANQGAAGTIMQGQGQRIQGLGSVLNSQTSMAGQAAASGDATMGAIGSVAGLAGAVVI